MWGPARDFVFLHRPPGVLTPPRPFWLFAAAAEQMIATQAESFLRWLEGRVVVPTITALHGHHDRMRAAELERARKLLAGGTPPDQVLEQLARGLTNKFLHAPTQALNQAGDAERAELVAMFERIYRIPDVDGH